MKITALLLTIAFAQDGSQAADTQGADTQGADTQGADTTSQGYGEEQQSYGEESYAPAYAAPAVVHAPKVCFEGCPKNAPCYGAGGCQPTACTAAPVYAPAYAAPTESYGAQTQESGYRRLQGYEEGEQSYGQAQTYAAPSYAAAVPATTCGCPAGTVDTSHLSLQSPIILWVAFILLFIPAFIFICRGAGNMREILSPDYYRIFQAVVIFSGLGDNNDEVSVGNEFRGDTKDKALQSAAQEFLAQIFHVTQLPRMLAGIVCTIASLAYLTMATGHGYIIKCNGRAFYYARYVDWFLTTPLMLIDIAGFSGFGGAIFTGYLVAMDLLMIVAGLIGELIEGPEKWAFFGFAIIFFLPILWWLCSIDASDGVMCGAAYGLNDAQTLYQRIAALTWVMWLGYPIVWILVMSGGKTAACAGATYATASYGEEAQQGYRSLQGTGICASVPGLISVTAEAFIYTILDVISKSIFGFIIVFHNWTDWSFCFGQLSKCSEGEDIAKYIEDECKSSNAICGWKTEPATEIVAAEASML
jgi:bacteriorhodopsin